MVCAKCEANLRKVRKFSYTWSLLLYSMLVLQFQVSIESFSLYSPCPVYALPGDFKADVGSIRGVMYCRVAQHPTHGDKDQRMTQER